MKTKDEILAELPNFYGTESYHRLSILFPTFVLTDGAKYIADACSAWWLMDAIASHRRSYKDDGFVVASLAKDGEKGTWNLLLTDGDDHELASQEIGYSDFPLDEITLYLVKQDTSWVVLLPSEY